MDETNTIRIALVAVALLVVMLAILIPRADDSTKPLPKPDTTPAERVAPTTPDREFRVTEIEIYVIDCLQRWTIEECTPLIQEMRRHASSR